MRDVRDVRRMRRTARRLADQPQVANAAAQGRLSPEQLDQVSDLVDPDGEPVAVGRVQSVLSDKTTRGIRQPGPSPTPGRVARRV